MEAFCTMLEEKDRINVFIYSYKFNQHLISIDFVAAYLDLAHDRRIDKGTQSFLLG